MLDKIREFVWAHQATDGELVMCVIAQLQPTLINLLLFFIDNTNLCVILYSSWKVMIWTKLYHHHILYYTTLFTTMMPIAMMILMRCKVEMNVLFLLRVCTSTSQCVKFYILMQHKQQTTISEYNRKLYISHNYYNWMTPLYK
jgi:hypothetical protein